MSSRPTIDMTTDLTNNFAAPAIDTFHAQIKSEDIDTIAGRPNANNLIALLIQLGLSFRKINAAIHNSFFYT